MTLSECKWPAAHTKLTRPVGVDVTYVGLLEQTVELEQTIISFARQQGKAKRPTINLSSVEGLTGPSALSSPISLTLCWNRALTALFAVVKASSVTAIADGEYSGADSRHDGDVM